MKHSDFDEFRRVLHDVCQMLSRGAYKPSDTSDSIFFNTLRRHDLATVKAALSRHCSRSPFVPTPFDLLTVIEGDAAQDGRPGGDEAWATALLSSDESASVCWSAETAEAFGVARVLLGHGDKIGARKAFLEVYDRKVAEARKAQRSAVWTVSLGSDAAGRALALSQAAERGVLNTDALPAPDSSPTAPKLGLDDVLRIGVDAGKVVSTKPPEEVMAALLAARDDVKAREAERGIVRRDERTADLKHASAERVAAYIAAQGPMPAPLAPAKHKEST